MFVMKFVQVVLCEQDLGSKSHPDALQPLDNDPAETCSVVPAVPGLGAP